jgi:hypothetical protein
MRDDFFFSFVCFRLFFFSFNIAANYMYVLHETLQVIIISKKEWSEICS